MDNVEPGIWSPLELLLVLAIVALLAFIGLNVLWTIRAILWLMSL